MTTQTPGEAPVRRVTPRGWGVHHIAGQVAVLLLAGIGLLLTTWKAPVYHAVFDRVPDLDLGVFVLTSEWYLPLVTPLALGIPLALTRYRAPLLLWIFLMTLLAVLAVIETSRLNWYAFSRGIAYRLESGPVPLVRTAGGVLLFVCAALLLAQQSVRLSMVHLAARGVFAPPLSETRTGLLRLERLFAVAGVGFGLVLTAIVAVSLRATERAPEPSDSILVPLAWAAVLVVALLGALAWGLRRRKSGGPSR